MNNRRDHRDQRRRGFGADAAPFSDEEPSYFQRQPAGSGSGSATDAEVLWFNSGKGFGFVRTADGTEAFLHVRALEAAGHQSVSEGTRLKVTVENAPKGKQVSQVLEVTGGSAPRAGSQYAGRAPQGARSSAVPEQEREGTVKWYNADKGFGFISIGGEKDVFVHATTLTRSGLSTLAEGQRVMVGFVQGQKGPEARTLRPL